MVAVDMVMEAGVDVVMAMVDVAEITAVAATVGATRVAEATWGLATTVVTCLRRAAEEGALPVVDVGVDEIQEAVAVVDHHLWDLAMRRIQKRHVRQAAQHQILRHNNNPDCHICLEDSQKCGNP